MKNYLYITLFIALYLLAGFSLTLGLSRLSNFRVTEATRLENSSKIETNAQNKLIQLIESDVLSPNDEKKLEIAKIYILRGGVKEAKYYLNKISSQNGIIKSTQLYLEAGDVENARNKIARINDKRIAAEFNNYTNLLLGKNEIANSAPEEARTNLGNFINAISTGDVRFFKNVELFDLEASKIIDESSPLNPRLLTLASYLINKNQPFLAIFILNKVEGRTGKSTVIFELKSDAYAKISNDNLALSEIENAIKVDPSKKNNYQKAVIYARKTKNDSTADHLSSILRYLSSISN